MRTALFFLCLLSGLSLAQGGEAFVPRLAIDHKKLIDEALHHLLSKRPALKPENLELIGLNYSFQSMPGTESVCGPEGCKMIPAAPFMERLNVSFKILDSKRVVTKDGRQFHEWDGLNVQFPTPRMPNWSIGASSINSAIPDPPVAPVAKSKSPVP